MNSRNRDVSWKLNKFIGTYLEDGQKTNAHVMYNLMVALCDFALGPLAARIESSLG